jgi:hypothetical protein
MHVSWVVWVVIPECPLHAVFFFLRVMLVSAVRFFAWALINQPRVLVGYLLRGLLVFTSELCGLFAVTRLGLQ